MYERLWCHAALAKMEGARSLHLPPLGEALVSDDERTSEVAARALTMIGAEARSIVPQAVAALKKPTSSKTDLGMFLAQVGKDASPAIPQLIELLNHSHPITRQTAAYALSTIGGREVLPAAPALAKLFDDPKYYVREKAAEALGSIGPAADDSIPSLISQLKGDEHERCRNAAAGALGKIGPTSAVVLEALKKAMQDESRASAWNGGNRPGRARPGDARDDSAVHRRSE